MDLKNSTVLITGGTSGLGLEFVRQLTKIGAKVIVTGRKLEALNETKKEFPNVEIFQSDVSNPEDIKQLFHDVTSQFPDLNIVINNAGMMRLIDLQDQTLDLENINREVATNLSGTIQMVHQFLPHLLTKKSAGIVNVSSGIAFMSYSAAPIYSATKAGIRAYTQSLRLQLEDSSVQVFEMIPPGVKTKLQDDWVKQPNDSMMMNADEMVKIAISGMLKDKKELKPFMISVIKFASRLMPNVLLKFGHGEFKAIKKLKRQA
ncbi:SDR family oxidoreductase [Sphingobacterium deserti]|uniref:Short-chain dehydrogenase/reductase SDR n=1 Tax=Sphingobacterium deserti TaxID=1229276 RepID=A0A0B8T6R0_9SPHI|nr:SDR family NAD(P)-dependent oxidoreductase [Sphingobacterium deserti]KGE13819.1 short-chain dehydrogenase/reductase SDR [Sphingobacterium deserti]